MFLRQAYYFYRVKSVSVYFLLVALAAMTYLNIGQVAQVSVGIEAAKQEAQRNIQSTRGVVDLTITSEDFSTGKAKYTGKNEIIISGKLYDIVSQKQDGNAISLKVKGDEKEEGLMSDLKNMVDGWFGTQPQGSHKQPLAKQIDLIKDFIPASKFTFLCNNTLAKAPCISNSFLTSPPLLSVLKSPPQLG